MNSLDPGAMDGLRNAAEEFNSGRFFECHDVLEDVWLGLLGPPRDFFQGLIHVAVGFYHLSLGNLSGAESQLDKGLRKLSNYPNGYLGMELVNLRSDIERWLTRIRGAQPIDYTVESLPKYRFLEFPSE